MIVLFGLNNFKIRQLDAIIILNHELCGNINTSAHRTDEGVHQSHQSHGNL